MTHPAWELQKAVYGKLVAESAVLAVLGGARIHDEVPRGAPFPYVTFGPSAARDWSTGTEDGSEHALTLRVWSKGGGAKEVLSILDAIRTALHDAALTLETHSLVSLRHEVSDVGRESDGETHYGVARFRALIEPAD